MNPLIQFKKASVIVLGVLACFGLLPQTQAIGLPPEIPGNPDGCYPAFTTAEGCNALFLVDPANGIGNTAVGWYSLFEANAASFNTGVGAGALALTTHVPGAGSDTNNTAVGTAAMLLNTSGDDNVAVGTDALLFNNDGSGNNAVGSFALFNNGSGEANHAMGNRALLQNRSGFGNTAIGDLALENNDSSNNSVADFNTAVGDLALRLNVDGAGNTAVGSSALQSNLASQLTAVGFRALEKNTTPLRWHERGRFRAL